MEKSLLEIPGQFVSNDTDETNNFNNQNEEQYRTVIDKRTNKEINGVISIITDKNKKIYFRISSSKNKFFFICFNNLNKLLDTSNKYYLTKSDLFRLIYIASFLNYDNHLALTERTLMSKDDLFKKLHINYTTFRKLYCKLLKLGVLLEIKDKERKIDCLSIDKKYFVVGRVPKKVLKQNYIISRCYKEAIKQVYENTDPRNHKRIGYLFCLLPLINKENIVCDERGEEIDLHAIADYLNYEYKSFIRMIKYVTSLKFDENNKDINFLKVFENSKKCKCIMFNPKYIFWGDEYKKVKLKFSSL